MPADETTPHPTRQYDADTFDWHLRQSVRAALLWDILTGRRNLRRTRASDLLAQGAILAWAISILLDRPESRWLAAAFAILILAAARHRLQNVSIPQQTVTLRSIVNARKGRANLHNAAEHLAWLCQQNTWNAGRARRPHQRLARTYLRSWDHDSEQLLRLLGPSRRGDRPACGCAAHLRHPVDCSMSAGRIALTLTRETCDALRRISEGRLGRLQKAGDSSIDLLILSAQRAEQAGEGRQWAQVAERLAENWAGSLDELADCTDTLLEQPDNSPSAVRTQQREEPAISTSYRSGRRNIPA